jgi:NAD-dependent SIR2 family protein deacetylase
VAMHAWIYKQKGKAKNYKCVDCGKQAIDWSNKNHSYRRVLEDYFPRCRSCHKIYDKKFE